METTINTSYKTPIVTPSECGDRVYRTYFINGREHEPMGGTWSTLDIAAFGRQEDWEDSPPGWPQQCSITRTTDGPPAWPPVPEWPGGRPIAQWPRLQAGRSDDLGTGHDGR